MLPSKILSQGIWWTVRLSDDIDDCGQTDYAAQTIIIRASLSPELQLATLIHEIFHTLNSTIDHTLLDSLSLQVFQVLTENNLWTLNN